jgi:hypothetical protein
MARGKHQAARATKERHAVDALAAEIAAEINAEHTRIAAAQRRAEQARAARARLEEERAALGWATEAEHRRLGQLVAELTDLVTALEESSDAVYDGWQRYGRKVIHRVGGQAAFRTLLRGIPTIVLPEGGFHTANAVAIARVAARGQKPPPGMTGEYDPLSWYAPWLPEPLRLIGMRLREYRPLGTRGVATGTDTTQVREVPPDLRPGVDPGRSGERARDSTGDAGPVGGPGRELSPVAGAGGASQPGPRRGWTAGDGGGGGDVAVGLTVQLPRAAADHVRGRGVGDRDGDTGLHVVAAGQPKRAGRRVRRARGPVRHRPPT